MKKVLVFALTLLLLIVQALTAISVSSSSEMDIFIIANFSYQVPKGWISTEVNENGFRYHYAKELKNAEDGYIAAKATDIEPEQLTGISLDEFYNQVIEGIRGSEGHISDSYIKKIDINGIDSRLYGRKKSLTGKATDNATILAYADGKLLFVSFLNEDFNEQEAEALAIELTKNIWCLQTFAGEERSTKAFSAQGLVLSDSWMYASLHELQAAQLQLSERISQLQAVVLDPVEGIEISGTGTEIKTGIKVDFMPARVSFTGNGKVTLTGGSYDVTIKASTFMVESMDETGEMTALVEAKGDWTLVIEPITQFATLPLSGEGPYVSDFIELPSPMIVTIAANSKKLSDRSSNFITKFFYEYSNISGWSYDSLTNELFWGPDEFEDDIILQPQKGREKYFIEVFCQPGVEWSITPKQ